MFLGKNFLDFEPGIHYPQIQMQAGETGINMLRIYNPTKNAIEHDKNAEFIKKWVPEISNIEGPLIFEPWKMTEIDQKSCARERHHWPRTPRQKHGRPPWPACTSLRNRRSRRAYAQGSLTAAHTGFDA